MNKSKKRQHAETATPATETSFAQCMGQRLLALARSPNDDEDATIAAFVQAIGLVSARGLIQGNQSLAEQVLRNAALTNNDGNKKKRKHKRGDQQQQKQPTLDVQLLLLACLRGLECNNDITNNPWLPCLAADLMTASIRYIQDTYSTPTLLFLAEFELISGSAKALLTALLPHANNNSNSTPSLRTAVLRTATRCISLMPHRWKRSAALLSQWRTSDSLILVPPGAPRLYAALAMVATTDTTVAQQWSQHVDDTTRTLQSLAQRMLNTTTQQQSIVQHGTWQTVVETQWLPAVQQAATESEVTDHILKGIDVLVQALTSLLTRDTIGRGSAAAAPVLQHLQGARINLALLLSACEALLSFPSAAEGIWKKTKKRLRKEPLEQGLRISPATLVGSLAAQLQAHGHTLLHVLVRSLGATVLLPYSRRLFQHCYQILLWTTPVVLRSLVDPTQLMPTSSKKNSKPAEENSNRASSQANAFASLATVVVSLGLDATHEATGKAITLTCGHVVSHLGGTLESTSSRSDRHSVFVSALEFLTQCLNSGGEFLPHDVRELIDSVMYTCCIAAADKRHPFLAGDERIHNTLCDLGVAVLTTPHIDGASCDVSLPREIGNLARSQPGWAKSASTMHVCNALVAPRLPALHVVSSRASSSEQQPASVTALLSRIATAQEDLLQLHSSPQNGRNQADTMDTSLNAVLPDTADARSAVQPSVDATKLSQQQLSLPQKVRPEVSASSPVQDVVSTTVAHASASTARGQSKEVKEDSDEDFDMPGIVDCGPDEEDE